MWWDLVPQDQMYLARMWQYPRKTFCSVYFRAAPLIIKKITILIQTPTRSYSWITTIPLCLLRLFNGECHGECQWSVRSTFCSCLCKWIRGRPSSRFRCECCPSLIWAATKHTLLTLTTPLTPVSHRKRLKDIQICIHAAAGPERATQTAFNHT